MTAAGQTTLDPAEVEKFSKMAAEWWNPKGKFGVLHVFNPVRLAFIKEQVCARFGRDPYDPKPVQGPALPRYRLRRRAPAPNPWPGSAPTSSASTPRKRTS